MFSERFSNLPAYAFPRLRTLLDGHMPGGETVQMTIGEPRHPFPDWVADTVLQHAGEFQKYPPNDGTPELLSAIADWLDRRFRIQLDPETHFIRSIWLLRCRLGPNRSLSPRPKRPITYLTFAPSIQRF